MVDIKRTLLTASRSHDNSSRSYAAVVSTLRSTANRLLLRKSREDLKTVTRGNQQVPEFVGHQYLPVHCPLLLTTPCYSSTVSIVNINPPRRELPNELVEMIVHHLCNDPRSISRLLRVRKKLFFLLASRLWLHGDPEHLQASCVKTHKRRTLYASFIRSIHFWSHEKFWNGSISYRPVFSNIRSLELFDTALRMNPAQDLVPFLSSTLERLAIYSDGSYTPNKPEQGADALWLKHATLDCRVLKEVYFEFEPATSHDTLIEFFRGAQHLTKLTLSDSVNPVLSNTLIKVFMSLPKLEVLELNYPITLAMVTQIKGALPILPRIRELSLTFSERAGTAPSILLEGLHSLQHLEISLGNSTSNWFYDINTSVFKTFARLASLQNLVVWVHPGLHITDAEITALMSLESLRSLEIYQMPDATNVDDNEQDRAWRSALQTTAESLTAMLVALKNLEWLHIELACDPVDTPTTMHCCSNTLCPISANVTSVTLL